MYRTTRASNSLGGGSFNIRLIIGIVMAIFAAISYFTSQEFNPITGETQYLSMTPQQEIALGLQAAPEMIQEFGGLYADREVQVAIDQIGNRLIQNDLVRGTPWRFEFSVLDDPNTVNAFALPGGQTFITTGLLSLLESEDEVAGVMAHEIVHVLARHSAQRIAQNDLTNGLIGAVAVGSGDANAAQTAAMVASMINMSYGRGDELQSDKIGVCLMILAGYDPEAMVRVMQVLAEASGSSGQPEFASTHPSPDNRIQQIRDTIDNAESICVFE
jgi:predicted Zn-dependent protease